jgi:peptide deformylase
MPIKEIITDKKALSVPCIETTLEEARPVIQDLMDTANSMKRKCAGLAANQIGSNLRVFVIKIRCRFVAFVNPSFSPSGPIVVSTEGCLSFPGSERTLSRYNIIITSPPKGKKKLLGLTNLEAVAFQHELDHLNGKTIMDAG